jgi:hypothetical protein
VNSDTLRVQGFEEGPRDAMTLAFGGDGMVEARNVASEGRTNICGFSNIKCNAANGGDRVGGSGCVRSRSGSTGGRGVET